jgi:RHS repeat-associated protein
MRTLFVAVLSAFLSFPGAVRAETLYFIHVDHLNTPRLAVSEDSWVHWRWEQAEPFGENPAIELMGTEGYLTNLPLRFPGQYFDKETNLHYNYFRDYDPGIGRYIQSDPIGLHGGLNTYVYVHGSPLAQTDLYGLESCKGTWQRIKWERVGIEFGVKGKSMPVLVCLCYWLCLDCSIPVIYDPNRLSTTRGFVYWNSGASPSNRGGADVGNNCFCGKPGSETGCSCKP